MVSAGIAARTAALQQLFAHPLAWNLPFRVRASEDPSFLILRQFGPDAVETSGSPFKLCTRFHDHSRGSASSRPAHLFRCFPRKRRFLGRNAVSPICSPPNKFAARNASSSAAPYEGWSVEIQPVRSTERDLDAKSDPNRRTNRGPLLVLLLRLWLPHRPGFRQEESRAQRQRQRPLIDAGNGIYG